MVLKPKQHALKPLKSRRMHVKTTTEDGIETFDTQGDRVQKKVSLEGVKCKTHTLKLKERAELEAQKRQAVKQGDENQVGHCWWTAGSLLALLFTNWRRYGN